MKIVYARQKLPLAKDKIVPNSVFVVGPTPRDKNTPSWRPEAAEYLKDSGFNGYLFYPEDENFSSFTPDMYDEQIWWEIEALAKAAVVLIWLPRKLSTMPAFTTNSEFGFLIALKPHRLVIGIPETAEKVEYQRQLIENIDKFRTMFGFAKMIPELRPVVHTDLLITAQATVNHLLLKKS